MPLDLSVLDDANTPAAPASAPVPGTLDLSLLNDGSGQQQQPAPQPVSTSQAPLRPGESPEHAAQMAALDKQLRDSIATKQAEGAGLLRGAAGIGHTLLMPVQWISDQISPPQQSLSGLINGRAQKNPVSAYIDRIGQAGSDLDSQYADSGWYKLGKLESQVAMTYPVGGILGKLAGAAAMPRLAAAIESGGMTTGAAPVAADASLGARALAAVGNLGIRGAGGAINGAATAGLIDPSSAGSGAALGAALPLTVSALGSVGKGVGQAYSALNPLWSKKGALAAATDKAATAIGPADLQQAIGSLQTYYPKGAENIPITSAAVTGSPGLAQLEQGSRLAYPTNWMDFDRNQAKAVFDNVMNATQEAGGIGAAKQARSAAWDAAWDKAMANFKPRVWNQEMGALGPKLDQALVSPPAANPDVRNMLQAIKDEVMRVGSDFSPAHLQQIRANLSASAYNPVSGNAFASAPRDNPATLSVLSEIDRILNRSTSGKWDQVLGAYSQGSTGVDAAKAASKVQSSFMDPDTGRLLVKTIDPQGSVPILTDSALTRAMNAARAKDGSQVLSPQAADQLNATINALRQQNVVQNLKRSATARGGSDTVSNALAALPFVGKFMSAPLAKANAARDQALYGLLSNPDALAAQLNAYRGAAAPVAPGALGEASRYLLSRSAPAALADH